MQLSGGTEVRPGRCAARARLTSGQRGEGLETVSPRLQVRRAAPPPPERPPQRREDGALDRSETALRSTPHTRAPQQLLRALGRDAPTVTDAQTPVHPRRPQPPLGGGRTAAAFHWVLGL